MLTKLKSISKVQPGISIKECMEYEFANKLGLSAEELEDLFDGKYVITEEFAGKLENVCGASKQFWLNYEHNWRNDEL